MKLDNQTLERLTRLIHFSNGFSYSLALNKIFEAGEPFYFVSVPEHEWKREFSPFMLETSELIKNYVDSHQSELLKPQNVLGAWVYNGLLYLDVSEAVHQRHKTLETVLKLAKSRNQLAIFDLLNNRTINIA
jgi:hypothetical protein